MGIRERLKQGLHRSREAINEIFYFGGEVDESFWEELEDKLVLSDIGPELAMAITDDLREIAARENITQASELKRALAKQLASSFVAPTKDPFSDAPACVIFVGINGAGKTTTIGKLAKAAVSSGKTVLLGGADTFRAAAIEQLDVWADRAGVELITRERGADPASVCYDCLARAHGEQTDLVLIDTAGRLHNSQELMRELAKVVNVTRKQAHMPVYVVLVIDATTGQNGLVQAREFNSALDVDGVILTKLDGTAKGGIASAISSQLNLPIYRIGIGEHIDDFQVFSPEQFANALVGIDE